MISRLEAVTYETDDWHDCSGKETITQIRQSKEGRLFAPFFKTGEGDRFLGVIALNQKNVAQQFKQLEHRHVIRRLGDSLRGCRLTGLLVLVSRYEHGDAARRQQRVDFYLAQLDRVNNWSLVDSSTHKTLGAHRKERDRSVLYDMAASNRLWRQRASMISCLWFIKRADFRDALNISKPLLNHKHDLIHKAVDWMLREVAKQDTEVLESFPGVATRRCHASC